ncbi:MAG: ABC transporter permease [Spirochaetota bacterium]|nr:MAG: ABC transporter permease [Spirochaetota bacterium]
MLTKKIDRVLFSGIILGLLSFGLKFIVFKENRLVRGDGLYLWHVLSPYELFLFIAPWILIITFMLLSQKRDVAWGITGLLANIVILLVFLFIGQSGTRLITGDFPYARISIGAGAWLFLLAAYIIIVSSLKHLRSRKLFIFFVSSLGFIVLVIFAALGLLEEISILKEYATRKGRFLNEFGRHLVLAGTSVLFAVVIGIPFGLLAFRRKLFSKPLFVFVNSVQTIPSLALFGIMIAPLAILSQRYPLLRELGIKGVGGAPAIIALTLYALLPITRNTYTSLEILDPSVIESARGMGMSKIQILFNVEIPLSIPVVLGGVRISLVQAIGNTTVAALIGAGGFGVFVFQGLGQAVPDLILLGALPVIALAIAIDKIFELLISMVTPKGIRPQAQRVGVRDFEEAA